jgi:glycosyltransferase involved in cell wall biosynthesis
MHHISAVGGASFCLLNILKTVDRSIVEPTVALVEDGPLKKEIEKLGIRVVYFKEMMSAPYCQSLRHIQTIRRYLKLKKSDSAFDQFLYKHEGEFDAVYLNNMMLWHYLPACKHYGLKTIIHIREHWPFDRKQMQLGWIKKTIRFYADQIVAINSYSALMMKEFSERTSIVYDWIDFTDRYEERPFDEIFCEDASKLKVYLFTGGNQIIKGAAEVMEVFHKHITDPNARLLAMGTQSYVLPNNIKHKLKCFLMKFGFNYYAYRINQALEKDSRIVCIESTYYIQHIIQQAYCYLSFFNRAHANLALAECITQKTVCVAARTPESEEYSDGGRLAFLFREKDQHDFAQAIEEADEHYYEMKEKLEDGSKRIAELFDSQRNACILNSVYDKLISE